MRPYSDLIISARLFAGYGKKIHSLLRDCNPKIVKLGIVAFIYRFTVSFTDEKSQFAGNVGYADINDVALIKRKEFLNGAVQLFHFKRKKVFFYLAAVS